MTAPLSPEMLTKFVRLAGELSPENLMADGERPAAAAKRIERAIKVRWAALERELGRPVSEDEVWAQFTRRPRSGVTFR
jgi:hypothetical protein